MASFICLFQPPHDAPPFPPIPSFPRFLSQVKARISSTRRKGRRPLPGVLPSVQNEHGLSYQHTKESRSLSEGRGCLVVPSVRSEKVCSSPPSDPLSFWCVARQTPLRHLREVNSMLSPLRATVLFFFRCDYVDPRRSELTRIVLRRLPRQTTFSPWQFPFPQVGRGASPPVMKASSDLKSDCFPSNTLPFSSPTSFLPFLFFFFPGADVGTGSVFPCQHVEAAGVS